MNLEIEEGIGVAMLLPRVQDDQDLQKDMMEAINDELAGKLTEAESGVLMYYDMISIAICMGIVTCIVI